ncbi:hypothetical protein GIV40_01340 [Pseudomonas poae]|uniref:DUF5677 domain-containing protein n=1 Tax=Pseudomonas poae TaxID=200451 RepID=UPI001F2F90EA|nr:DUF5677 domain-containing protein [Pseudomonas poae]MCF5775732.1 hypothetical protein [Pseudomonas poae]
MHTDVVKADFDVLLTLISSLIDAQVGKRIDPGDGWQNDAQTLSIKFFKQLCSCRTILKPCSFQFSNGSELRFVDHSSIMVLARACLESFLTLHWIFGATDRDLKSFRHSVWMFAGLQDRIKLNAISDEGRKKQEDSRAQALELMEKIESSIHVKSYTSQQVKELKKGDWKIGWNWRSEAVKAGYHPKHFDNIYKHLCGYSHSSYISALQVGAAQSLETQRFLADGGLQVCVHVMAKFVLFYSSLFTAAEQIYAASGDAQKVVARWGFRPDDMDHLFEQDLGG